MKVFKFGGASVSNAERIRNVADILKKYKGQQILIVVSAMGKTTNALEKVAEAFYSQQKDLALERFARIREEHLDVARQLSAGNMPLLNDVFTEVEWLLHDRPVRGFDYYYDQIVCIGELLSTAITSHYLNQAGVSNQWLDVRDVIRTDNNFRDARIQWAVTKDKVINRVMPLFEKNDLVLTQGFIGATDENESTTLGREGSDYTAAVFANLLNAEGQTIWKDVQGVMNADPKLYSEAVWIKELNYREVIEMAYYGAQVIHPKTIQPLQNKDIPLYVKSFINPDAEGTVIHHKAVNHLPPIIVYKERQVLIQLSSKDYSFVGEGLSEQVFQTFDALKFKPNLLQNAAISMLCVVDDRPDKVEEFAARCMASFEVQVARGLKLLTIRHYTQELIDTLTSGHEIVLRQQTPETVQVVMKAKKEQ